MDNERPNAHYPQFIIAGTSEFLFCKVEGKGERYPVFSSKNMGFYEERIWIYG
ncbi:MAG: hypothetical protein LBH60_02710 [Prevotellaceae bacterium]|nr:hypothetical protein [Prevotellaceae bacterium]